MVVSTSVQRLQPRDNERARRVALREINLDSMEIGLHFFTPSMKSYIRTPSIGVDDAVSSAALVLPNAEMRCRNAIDRNGRGKGEEKGGASGKFAKYLEKSGNRRSK